MNALEIADIVGIIAFTLSGFMAATKDRLDLLGILIASFLTALGGGILRDTIADRTPYAFTNLLPTILVLSVIILSIILKLHNKSRIINNIYFVISDSIGLVSFSISGAIVGVLADFNVFGVVMLAFSTAVGGGIMRDSLLNRVPVIFVSELYATISILIGILVYMLGINNKISDLSIIIVFILGLTFRLVAYYRKWHLPKLESD
jgi:uncharacterized membrane protein YeiH